MAFDDFAKFKWLGKPNSLQPNTEPWKRTEFVRKMSGKTVAAFAKAAAGHASFAHA